MQGVLSRGWPTPAGGEDRHERLLVLWWIAIVTSSLPSFDISMVAEQGLDVSVCSAQLCRAASKDLGDALALYSLEQG